MLNLDSAGGNSVRPSVQDPVSLNVGGEIYTTTLDTLTRCRDSMLGAMFTGQIPALRDKQGNIFIDRDGKVFRYILNYLRSSCLDLPSGFSELALLRREADFFQIRPLLEEIRRYEESVPLSLRGGPLGAMLMVNVDSKVQSLTRYDTVFHCALSLCKLCSQDLVPSSFRSVFSTLTCAVGRKTTSSAHALCEPSPSTSSVPGEASWLCFVNDSPTEHLRVSQTPIHATPGRTD